MTASSTGQLRDKAMSIARSDARAALTLARRIEDPWFRCQALSAVARASSGDWARARLREACAAASEGRDAYRRIACLAWPLRAAIETGRLDEARSIADHVLSGLRAVEPPSSRAAAAEVLFDAAAAGPSDLWQPLASALIGLCDPAVHWRATRLHREAVRIMVALSPTAAREHAERLPEGKLRERSLEDAARGYVARPREFFW